MDTNKLKRFASEARNIIISGVNQRLTALGFQMDGSVTEMPELKGGGAVFMGDVQTEDFYHKWMSLYHRVQRHSYREVVEEAAYTWFNRFIAIRIMVKNELVPPVLEYESEDARIPLLVTEARQGRMPQMNEESRQKLETLLLNDALTDEQFQLLIVAYCHSNPIINKCFGTISDYTELLLPGNTLKNDGFIDRLNADDYISDDDYRSPELIGWLYQFYISERKDEVFAKKGKFEADEIPAATQIFTPNWIVKYMVQNTVGRIYLDNNPYSYIKEEMKYLVEPTEPTPPDAIYRFEDIHDLSCADLGCGSGHILNECFDLLYQIYIEEGYNRKKAVEDIFHYNLTGVDIDTRAKQLATFALLMKACQKDKSFADAHCMPKVLDMPVPYAEAMCKVFEDKKDERAFVKAMFSHFLLGTNDEILDEIADAIMLMNDAQTLGSIMKFNISERTRNIIEVRTAEYEKDDNLQENIRTMLPYMRVILALTSKYSALIMNPPYMRAANMNECLKTYVESEYYMGRFDMYSVFMKVAMDKIVKDSYLSMIVQPTWLVNYSFGDLRTYMVDHFYISSLLHMGRGNFGNDWGSIAFTLKHSQYHSLSQFYRLYERAFYRIEPEHINALFLKAKENHSYRYDFSKYSKLTFENELSSGKLIYYSCFQSKFKEIKNTPFCYSFTDEIIHIINSTKVSNYHTPATGLQAGDNSKFVRNWQEVSSDKLYKKWFPYVNGGNARRWYGNLESLVNWENDGYEIKHLFNPTTGKLRSRPQSQKFYFKEGITWNRIASKSITLRYLPDNCIFDQAGDSMFSENIESLKECMAYLNTKVGKTFFDMLAPGLNLTAGVIASLPYILTNCNKQIINLCDNNIAISKEDWDAHETSWDFQTNEIVGLDTDDKYVDTIEGIYKGTGIMVDLAAPQLESLEGRTDIIKQKWEDKFNLLHANEEELNRQFIEIYGLQDELTPDVPLSEVTILQKGEISIENDQLQWHDDILMKQLLSYAVGCMMGRYSIDKPGLILANKGDGQKEYETLVPNGRFEIDDDGIIPLMSANTEFTDNITLRFKTWLSLTFGEAALVENLNYIERALGKRLDDYFVKDFWKDHKKMYQNRPIYWLFSSIKGAFQCIVYMHRMNAYTAEKVRTNYLLPHIEWLLTKQSEMQANAANLSTHQRKEMDAIGKQIEECREYHDRLHEVADKQIGFDLDDGVIVNYAKFGDVLAKLK